VTAAVELNTETERDGCLIELKHPGTVSWILEDLPLAPMFFIALGATELSVAMVPPSGTLFAKPCPGVVRWLLVVISAAVCDDMTGWTMRGTLQALLQDRALKVLTVVLATLIARQGVTTGTRVAKLTPGVVVQKVTLEVTLGVSTGMRWAIPTPGVVIELVILEPK